MMTIWPTMSPNLKPMQATDWEIKKRTGKTSNRRFSELPHFDWSHLISARHRKNWTKKNHYLHQRFWFCFLSPFLQISNPKAQLLQLHSNLSTPGVKTIVCILLTQPHACFHIIDKWLGRLSAKTIEKQKKACPKHQGTILPFWTVGFVTISTKREKLRTINLSKHRNERQKQYVCDVNKFQNKSQQFLWIPE